MPLDFPNSPSTNDTYTDDKLLGRLVAAALTL
jgi:hypothetical protein